MVPGVKDILLQRRHGGCLPAIPELPECDIFEESEVSQMIDYGADFFGRKAGALGIGIFPVELLDYEPIDSTFFTVDRHDCEMIKEGIHLFSHNQSFEGGRDAKNTAVFYRHA